jgi:hypothetical protein
VQDVNDGALDTALGLHGVDVAASRSVDGTIKRVHRFYMQIGGA